MVAMGAKGCNVALFAQCLTKVLEILAAAVDEGEVLCARALVLLRERVLACARSLPCSLAAEATGRGVMRVRACVHAPVRVRGC
jgi:hypothetical protein